MRIKQKKNHKKKIIIALVVVLAIALAAFAIYFFMYRTPKQTGDSVTPPVSQNDTNADTDSTPETTPPAVNSDDADKTPVQNEPTTSSTAPSSLSGIVNFKSTADGTLTLRTTIDQKISNGTCTLTLTHESTGKRVERTAAVVANPSSATCKGFDVPTSELQQGSWNISVKLQSGNKKGEIKDEVSL